jgi:hypothetical protein
VLLGAMAAMHEGRVVFEPGRLLASWAHLC